MLTFKQAEAILGSREAKKVGNNTYLYLYDADTIGVRLHSTTVVKIHRNGVWTVTSGGWRSNTTKNRINEFSPASVSQCNFEWYAGGEVFYDEMQVDASGKVLAPV